MTGDQTDFLSRLRAVLPRGWFPDDAPVLDAVLTGIAYAWSWAFDLVGYAVLQTRLTTATDVLLDILSVDFFGGRISRNGDTDAAYRVRLRRELLRPKATRAAIIESIVEVTGVAPLFLEPANATDLGGYGSLTARGVGYRMGYDAAGAYGSRLLPFQAFVTVRRPAQIGLANVAGYNTNASGYGTLQARGANEGPSEYASLDAMRGVKDADIYEAIASVQPAAVVIWTKILDPLPKVGARLDIDFYLDRSTLS